MTASGVVLVVNRNCGGLDVPDFNQLNFLLLGCQPWRRLAFLQGCAVRTSRQKQGRARLASRAVIESGPQSASRAPLAKQNR